MISTLSIAKRLGIAFASLALFSVVIGAFALVRMDGAQATVLGLTHHSVPAVRELGQLATRLAEYRVSERGLVASQGDPAKIAEYGEELAAGQQSFLSELEAYR